jgi:PAS domain S-box-containing protein
MDDVREPVDDALPSAKVARMITLISSVNVNTRLTLCFVLIIGLMSVGTGILLWQSHVMRTQASRLKEMDEQFIEVQRVHALVLSFRNESEQLVKARNLARLQQEAPALRNQLNDSRRQTEAVFRGIEPNNILDPTVLPTLVTIESLLPSQVDSLSALASVEDWEALRRRVEQPLDVLNSLSGELVDTVSRDVQDKRSEAARQIQRAQIRALFIVPTVGGLTIVVAALLGFGITQTITRPLRSLVDAASALASGEFGHHVPVRGRDELAHLSQVFNQTTIKLQNLYENLRRSEQELRNIVNAMPAMIWRATPRGEIDLWNRTMIEAIGKAEETSKSLDLFSRVDPEQVAAVLERWSRSVRSGIPYEDAYRMLANDGKYHWYLVRGEPFRGDGETIINWFGIHTNIDALKDTESALQMREHQLLGIIETVPSMLWSTSPTGEVTHISQRLREYTGMSFEDFLNLGWKKIVHPDDIDDTAKKFFRAIETGESYSAINRLRRADGEYRWHHTMGEPLRDPQGKIIQWYGLSIDIDERKRAEDHLRDTRIKLATASRIATVAELSASIAHELNQPLMSIFANAQAAKRWLNVTPPKMTEASSSIDRIIRDARAADETMQRIRALFKQESFNKKEVNIRDIIHETVRFVQEDPKKREVHVECRFEEPLPVVSVDQIQIQQVFINLIVNAIEAMEGRQMPPLVRLLAAATDSNEMLIQVIDDGPGVDDPERIFDAFMTTKEKGMGIGLAISRSIIEAHGGRLWVGNNRDGGATFNIALPLSSTNRSLTQNPKTKPLGS